MIKECALEGGKITLPSFSSFEKIISMTAKIKNCENMSGPERMIAQP